MEAMGLEGPLRHTGATRIWHAYAPGLMFYRTQGHGPGTQADVAQLVERNLAKVEVASSSLVVRSERSLSW